MFQRSITNKMRVKWALNPGALPTNFPHAAHRAGSTPYPLPLRVYSISLLFTCVASLPKLRAINLSESSRERKQEREIVCVCLLRCLSVHWKQADVWTVRFTQVYGQGGRCFLAWTLALYTDTHAHSSDKKEQSFRPSEVLHSHTNIFY